MGLPGEGHPSMVTPTIEERAPFTVVGLETHFDGDESIFRSLWEAFGRRWDEFEGLAERDEAFGVVTNVVEEPMAFDYVVGVATTRADDAPDDFAVVEVPGGAYAVFETSLGSFDEDYASVLESWLPDAGHEPRPGPEYERYGPGYEGEDPDSPYQYFLPVDPVV